MSIKKISICLLFVFIFASAQVQAQESGIGSLGLSREQLETQRGAPLARSGRDGLTIYWYGTQDPFSAEFIYFRDDTVVMNSISVSGVQLGTYLNEYGNPEASIRKYKSDVEDPLESVISIWPKKGIAVQSNGLESTSTLMRIYRFGSTDLTHFLTVLSPDLSGNERLQLQNSIFLLPAWLRVLPLLPPPGTETSTYLFGAILIILFLSILIIVVRSHRPTYRPKPEPPKSRP